MDLDRCASCGTSCGRRAHSTSAGPPTRAHRPAVLSRQIRAFRGRAEGGSWFTRDKRGTALTPAGCRQLRGRRARPCSPSRGRRDGGCAGRPGAGRFAVGFMPGLIVTGRCGALRPSTPTFRRGAADPSLGTSRSNALHDAGIDVSFRRGCRSSSGGRAAPAVHSSPRVLSCPWSTAGRQGDGEHPDLARSTCCSPPTRCRSGVTSPPSCAFRGGAAGPVQKSPTPSRRMLELVAPGRGVGRAARVDSHVYRRRVNEARRPSTTSARTRWRWPGRPAAGDALIVRVFVALALEAYRADRT